jgi:hypothetical protein
MPALEDDPRLMEAFEILAGERSLPPNNDNTELLKYYRRFLRVGMDRALALDRGEEALPPFPEIVPGILRHPAL